MRVQERDRGERERDCGGLERRETGDWRDGRNVSGLEASSNNSQVFGVKQYTK